MADENPAWFLTGEQMPVVYHGGRAKVSEVLLDRLQKRDSGFYGKGFYVTTLKNHARTYGHVISAFRFFPQARIIESALWANDAPPGLQDAVREHLLKQDLPKARARGKEAQYLEWLESLPSEPIEWKNAVDRFGTDLEFDAIAHSFGEIVVKNPSSLQAVK